MQGKGGRDTHRMQRNWFATHGMNHFRVRQYIILGYTDFNKGEVTMQCTHKNTISRPPASSHKRVRHCIFMKHKKMILSSDIWIKDHF